MKSLAKLLLVINSVFLLMPLQAQDLEVTLVGTGSPLPNEDRLGVSTLVKGGEKTLLIDAGRGVYQRLSQIDFDYESLDAIFLTHLHSDHIVGLPDLWLTGWISSGRDRPLQVYGPVGTAESIDNLQEAFAFDLYTRSTFEGQSAPGSMLEVTEVEEGYVFMKTMILK